MLWAYLDDSGVRNRETGELRRYALGGGVAIQDEWVPLRAEWEARLKSPSNPSKVDWFHYREWKRAIYGHAKEGDQFYGWQKQQLVTLLADLTRIVSRTKVHYLCATVKALQNKRQVRESYRKVTTNVINRAHMIGERADPSEEAISFVFSRHAELPGTNIQKYWNHLSKLNVLDSRTCKYAHCVITDPRIEPLLQAADLIVNEMADSRFIQLSWGPKFHAPEITAVFQMLRQGPSWHQMIEYHEDDAKGPNDD